MEPKHYEHTVHADGRITIPKEIREAAGLGPSDHLTIEVSEGKLILTPVPRAALAES